MADPTCSKRRLGRAARIQHWKHSPRAQSGPNPDDDIIIICTRASPKGVELRGKIVRTRGAASAMCLAVSLGTSSKFLNCVTPPTQIATSMPKTHGLSTC
eukprot:9471480-Pyramimonas_sp.AAC.1